MASKQNKNLEKLTEKSKHLLNFGKQWAPISKLHFEPVLSCYRPTKIKILNKIIRQQLKNIFTWCWISFSRSNLNWKRLAVCLVE